MPSVAKHSMSLRDYLYERLMKIPQLEVISPPPGPLASPILTFTLPGEKKKKNNEQFALELLHNQRIVVKVVPKSITSSLKDEIEIPTNVENKKVLELYKEDNEIPTNVKNGIRISPHIYNTEDEIKRLLRVLEKEFPE